MVRISGLGLLLCATQALFACQEYSLDVTFEIPNEFLQHSLQDLCPVRCTSVHDQCMNPDTSQCEQLLSSCLEECDVSECQDYCYDRYGGCLEPVVDEEMCDLLETDCLEGCQQELVVSAVLRLYRPPAGNAFSCDDLAFDRLSADVLGASLLSEVEVDLAGERGQSFSGIDRVSRKILLALGLDNEGLPAVVACRELGEIQGREHVRLEAEPTAMIRFEQATAHGGEFPFVGNSPSLATVMVTDVFTRPLPDKEVIWTRQEPGGTSEVKQGMTDDEGRAELWPAHTEVPGPQLLVAQVRWMRERPPYLRWFIQPDSMVFSVCDSECACKPGRIGSSGESGVVCLRGEGNSLTCLSIVQFDPTAGGGGSFDLQSNCVEEEANQVALGLIPDGQRDRILLAGLNRLYLFTPDGNYTTLPFSPPGAQAVPKKVFPVESCTEPDDRLPFLVEFEQETTGVYSAVDGTSVQHAFASLPSPITVHYSGCVADQTGTERRTLGTNFGAGVTAFHGVSVEIGQGLVHIQAGLSMAPAFSPAVGQDSGYLVTSWSENDRAEIALHQIHYRPGLAESRIDLVATYPLFSFPLSVAAGDLDDDRILDVVGQIPYGEGSGLLQQVLGPASQDRALYGYTWTAGGIRRLYDLWCQDFDRDGKDDIVTLGQRYCEPTPECLEACDAAYEECVAGSNPNCEDQRDVCAKECPFDYCPIVIDVAFMGRVYPGDKE